MLGFETLNRRKQSMYTKDYNSAWERGNSDARKNRSPIFRSTRANGIVANGDDPMADNWDEEARSAYLAGFNAYEE